MITNYIATSIAKDARWFVNSVASHNITNDFSNRTTNSKYNGTNEVVIGDGSSLLISHVGSLKYIFYSYFFHLHDTLYVQNIQIKKKKEANAHASFYQIK